MLFAFTEPNDPTSQINIDFTMDKAMAYCKKLNAEQKDVHVTMTHVLAHAASWGLYKMRRDVGHLPFGTFKADQSYGITVLVDKDGGADLVPITIWDGYKMTIFEVAKACRVLVSEAKDGKNKKHNNTTAVADIIPTFIAQPLAFVLTYIAVVMGFNLNAFSMSKK